jgi:hypothetical protein
MNIEYLQSRTIVSNTKKFVKALYTIINNNKNEKNSIEINIKQTWAKHTMNMSESIWRLAKHIMIVNKTKLKHIIILNKTNNYKT